MSLANLKKALQDAVTDDFLGGDVIRWTASDKYVYAAIKSPVGWFTTAAEYNRHVPQIVTYEELVKILSRSEVSDVQFAITWDTVR
jgi:hypothetical protein